MDQYTTLPIGDVAPNPDQPRRKFDPRALDELARSITEHGILEPILVRPVPEVGHLIVAGERRWRAARLAGLERVPVIVKDLSESDAYAVSVVENVVRADMTPMEEARGYQALLDQGRDLRAVAQATGKTTRWVQMYLDLLALKPEIAELLDAGGLKIGVAWSFSRISPAGQQVALRKYLAGEFRSDRDAQVFATEVRSREAQADLFAEPITEADRKAHSVARRELMSKLAKLTQAWTVCNEIAHLEPALVAAALAGDGGAATYRDQVSMVVAEASKALSVLRRAAAADAVSRTAVA